MKITLTFEETVRYQVQVEWPDDQPLPEVGSDGDDDWFPVVDSSDPDWMKNGLVEVPDRELRECEVVK